MLWVNVKGWEFFERNSNFGLYNKFNLGYMPELLSGFVNKWDI